MLRPPSFVNVPSLIGLKQLHIKYPLHADTIPYQSLLPACMISLTHQYLCRFKPDLCASGLRPHLILRPTRNPITLYFKIHELDAALPNYLVDGFVVFDRRDARSWTQRPTYFLFLYI